MSKKLKEFFLASTLSKHVQCFLVEYQNSNFINSFDFSKLANGIDFKYFDNLFDLGTYLESNFSLNLNDSFDFISFRPGVTDNRSIALSSFLEMTYPEEKFKIMTGSLNFHNVNEYFNQLIHEKNTVSLNDLKKLDALFNIVTFVDRNVDVLTFNFIENEIDELLNLNKKQNWALSKDELLAIKNYFSNSDVQSLRKLKGMSLNPTDVEIEVIAQTWSEHCKHKIFNADIIHKFENGLEERIESIFKTYIKNTTSEINKDYAVSVFHDNAGVVDFDASLYLAIKVETHNSPSALDPYGGAITGILGVNRDILGTGLGFMPIANTDVFCVGPYDAAPLKNMFSPKDLLNGVHKGVMDGGNKSGIPTIAGAMIFDESYIGKPLVYCGTVGVSKKNIKNLDQKNKYLESEDLIVMAGGRVGADGIHGATMSSILMDKETPKSMVQIGDPFTQKKLTDFVIELKNQGLIKSITDNGAGGLSSSVGEMALQTNGAEIHLDHVPLKYLGLRPWEIMVSESQERMTLAIAPKDIEKVKLLSKKFQCEISILGKFVNSGHLEIFFHNEMIGKIDLAFLDKGNPKLTLKAKNFFEKIDNKEFFEDKKVTIQDSKYILDLLNDSDIASKEYFIRQYDHEVKAATLVKPLDGEINQVGPNDGGVIWLYPHGGDKENSISITMGMNPHLSLINPNKMAKLSVDEAVRGAVALGADIEKIALTDNFCWPDPVDSDESSVKSKYLSALVHSCQGLKEICLAYQAPLVSGKDSMKNDYKTDDQMISIKPTLLMTSIAKINSLEDIKKSYIKAADKEVYLLSSQFYSEYFGHYFSKVSGVKSIKDFNWDLSKSYNFYKKIYQNLKLIESIHDVSDGGAMISLLESLLVKKLGFQFSTDLLYSTVFSEYPSQFIVSVSLDNKDIFEKTFSDSCIHLGVTNNSGVITLKNKNVLLSIEEVQSAWGKKWN